MDVWHAPFCFLPWLLPLPACAPYHLPPLHHTAALCSLPMTTCLGPCHTACITLPCLPYHGPPWDQPPPSILHHATTRQRCWTGPTPHAFLPVCHLPHSLNLPLSLSPLDLLGQVHCLLNCRQDITMPAIYLWIHAFPAVVPPHLSLPAVLSAYGPHCCWFLPHMPHTYLLRPCWDTSHYLLPLYRATLLPASHTCPGMPPLLPPPALGLDTCCCLTTMPPEQLPTMHYLPSACSVLCVLPSHHH